jgi:hypothetical protein
MFDRAAGFDLFASGEIHNWCHPLRSTYTVLRECAYIFINIKRLKILNNKFPKLVGIDFA